MLKSYREGDESIVLMTDTTLSYYNTFFDKILEYIFFKIEL